jgi:hypothetical protein
MGEQLHYKLFCMRSSYERHAWADTPIVCCEYLKEASRCMIQAFDQITLDDPRRPGLVALGHMP